MDETEGEERIALRFKLRQKIRDLVKEIRVFPNGMKGQSITWENLKPEYENMESRLESELAEAQEFLDMEGDTLPKEDLEALRRRIRERHEDLNDYRRSQTGRDKRCFHVFFQSSAFKAVIFDPAHGYYIDSEMNQKNWRIGNQFQVMGDWVKIMGAGTDSGVMPFGQSHPDSLKNMTIPPDQVIKYSQVIYKPDTKEVRIGQAGLRIAELRGAGATWTQIKAKLEAEGIHTPSGLDKWHLSTISRIYSNYKHDHNL